MENGTSSNRRNQNRRTKINSPGKPDGSTVINSEEKADSRTVVNRSSSDSAPSPFCPPGTLLLDEFTVVSKLDVNSGEADLYVCEDASGNNRFVAKIYRRHDALKDSILDRLTALRSDHIVPVLKYGTFNDFPCLILPYFKNGSLKGKKFCPEIIKGMIVPCLLDGLKFLHENNILHKDIKPSNLMLSDDGKNVLIIDFGISSSFEAGQSVLVTKTGMSPEYSAPETFNNVFLKESDYYSLGITLYELVTGSTPFSNSSFSSDELAIMASINAVPFPEGFPPDLKELITGLTYKDLSNRDDPSNPNRRWTAPEVEKWLKGIRQNIPGRDSASISRQSEPQANATAGSDEDQIKFVKSYYFSDRLGRPQILHNISEFAEAFGQNWKDGKSHIGRGKVSEFFSGLGIQSFEILSREYEEESEKGELSDLSYFTFLLSIQGSSKEKFFYWKDHRYQSMDELGQYCFETFTDASSSGSPAKSRKKEKSDPNNEKSSEFSQITEAIRLWYLQNEQNDELKVLEKYRTLCQSNNFDLSSSSILLCSFLMKTFPVRIQNSVYDSPDDFFTWFDTKYRDDRNAALSWLSENENGIKLYSLCFNQYVAEKMNKLLKVLDVYRKKMEEERRIQEEEARRQEEERRQADEVVRQAEKARKKREKQKTDFKTAVKTCLVEKYVKFDGRASRSEFWWFYLACFVINSVAGIIARAIGDAGSILSLIVCLALFLPLLGAGARRLHDVNKSGWLQLLLLIPLIGFIILVIFWIKKPVEPNNYQ